MCQRYLERRLTALIQIAAQLKETKFAREGIMLDKYIVYVPLRIAVYVFLRAICRFFKMLGSDEMRAWYGPNHVLLAADRGAIGTLLISDELFRYVNLAPLTICKTETDELIGLTTRRSARNTYSWLKA